MYGTFNFPHLPYSVFPVGAHLGPLTVVPGGANVHFVRSTGAADYDPPELSGRLFSTINAALGQCRSGRGDTVLVLEGHTETIANDGDAWSGIVAGTRILGRGYGTMRPTITFGHANAQLDIDVANVWVENMIFKAAGPTGTTALTVANPFNVTAAGFNFVRNEVEVGIDADQLCTSLIKLSAAADDCTIANNYIYGALLAEITNVIASTGAVDRLFISGNVMSAAVVTAATGVLIDIDNAAIIENYIIGNRLQNKTASSKYVIDGHASSTGLIDNNRFFTADGGTAPAVSGVVGCDAMTFGINECSTAPAVSALLAPAVDS